MLMPFGINLIIVIHVLLVYLISQWLLSHAEGPGRAILHALSVRPSVMFTFRTLTRKRIAVFSRNFAGTCTMSWGCAVRIFLKYFILRFMLFPTFKISLFGNIE